MLSKLLKYELQATARIFLPVYAMILIVSVVNRVSFLFEFSSGFAIAATVLFALFVALLVLTAVFTILRFYKTLLGDEGYLMNTIPVSTDSLILSKFFSMLLWIALTLVIAILSSLIIIPEALSLLPNLLDTIYKAGGLNSLMVIMGSVFQLFSLIFRSYFSITVSQLQPFSNYRVASAFFCFLGINIVLSILTSCAAYITSQFIDWDTVKYGIVFSLVAIVNLALSTTFYLGARHILKNKLNLE